MKKEKHIGRNILIIVFVLMILASAGTAAYFGLIYKTPMQLFEISIDKINQNLSERISMDSSEGLVLGVGRITYEVNDTNQMEEQSISELNGINIDYRYNIDNSMGRYRLDMESTKNEENFFNSTLYSTNGKTYAYLKDFYDKYFLIDEKENPIKLMDANIAITAISKSIKDSLKEEYFETRLTRQSDITNYTMSLNKKQKEQLLTDIFSKIKSEKSITNYIDTEDIEDIEDKILDKISDKNIRITISTKGIKKEFYNFGVMTDGKDGFTINISKKEKEKLNFIISNHKGFSIDGDIARDAQVGNNGHYDNYAISFTTTNNIKFTSKIENTTSYDKEFKEVAIENPIKYINMSDSEKEEIKTTLKTSNGIANFENSFKKYFKIGVDESEAQNTEETTDMSDEIGSIDSE